MRGLFLAAIEPYSSRYSLLVDGQGLQQTHVRPGNARTVHCGWSGIKRLDWIKAHAQYSPPDRLPSGIWFLRAGSDVLFNLQRVVPVRGALLRSSQRWQLWLGGCRRRNMKIYFVGVKFAGAIWWNWFVQIVMLLLCASLSRLGLWGELRHRYGSKKRRYLHTRDGDLRLQVALLYGTNVKKKYEEEFFFAFESLLDFEMKLYFSFICSTLKLSTKKYFENIFPYTIK